ncbi:hypothetical protein EYR36_000172 [Pleurotus pulmonarius]|nr:hypothetical protein EYR36_000172 [Pleurotus pulmonarius]
MQYGSSLWQPWILEEETAIQHIKAAYDLGIQTFDVSDVYSNGMAETVLGNAIKRLDLPREEIVIMSKIGHFIPKGGPGVFIAHTDAIPEELGLVNQGGLSRKHIFDSVKASLTRLQLDYIDVLQCHFLHPDTPLEEVMVALHDIVKAGYARYIGLGTYYAWHFQYMQNYALNNRLTPFISVQNHYCLLHREAELELYPTIKMFGVGSVPYSPLARGHLSRPVDETTDRSTSDRFFDLYKLGPWEDDKEIIRRVQKLAEDRGVSMTQISLAWLLHKKGVTAPIIGPTSIEQIEDSIGALNISFTKEEMSYLEEPYKARPELRKYLIPNCEEWEAE